MTEAEIRFRAWDTLQGWGRASAEGWVDKTWDFNERMRKADTLAAWAMSGKLPENVPYVPATCSFCGKPKEETKRLFAGPGVSVCNECVDMCSAIMRNPDADA